MMSNGVLCLGFLVGLALVPSPAGATPIVIGFDSLQDGDTIDSQYVGLTVSDTIALASGISLNELEFPPHSGSTVASDNGGPIRIDFAQAVDNVGGYFTYAEPLTLEAFTFTNILLGSVSSSFFSNEALSGDSGSSPNEFLQLAFSNIAYVTFAGDPLGGSFTLDDLSFTPATPGSPVPEPGTLTLVLLGGLSALRYRRRGAVTATAPRG